MLPSPPLIYFNLNDNACDVLSPPLPPLPAMHTSSCVPRYPLLFGTSHPLPPADPDLYIVDVSSRTQHLRFRYLLVLPKLHHEWLCSTSPGISSDLVHNINILPAHYQFTLTDDVSTTSTSSNRNPSIANN